jgi:hypothetical protein
MPNNTSSVPTAMRSMSFEEMAALATRIREQAIDDAALRVLAAVSGSEMTVCQAPPGVLPPDRLFVVFVAPEVMARLRELTKGPDHV